LIIEHWDLKPVLIEILEKSNGQNEFVKHVPLSQKDGNGEWFWRD
jgi:hypothetical protein